MKAAHAAVWLSTLVAAGVAPGCGDDGGSASGSAGASGAGSGGRAGGKAGTGGNKAGGAGKAGTGGSLGNGPCGARPPEAPPGWDEVVEGWWTCKVRVYRNPHPEDAPTWEWRDDPTLLPGTPMERLIEPDRDGPPLFSTLGRGTSRDGALRVARRRYVGPSTKAMDMYYEVFDPETGKQTFAVFERGYHGSPVAQVEGGDPSAAGGLNEDRAVLGIVGDGEVEWEAKGGLFGALMFDVQSSAEPFLWSKRMEMAGGLAASYAPSEAGLLLHFQGLELVPTDGSPSIRLYYGGNDPEGLPGYFKAVRGAEVLIEASAAGRSGYYSWSREAGLRAFLRVPGDVKQAWSGLATDGKDLVWTYSEGQQTGEYQFPKHTLQTSPWTIDPAEVAAKTRSLGPDDGLAPFGIDWVVGCGYAVKADGPHLGPTGRADLRIIRLSDGARWLVPNESSFALGVWAVSCTHVYLETSPVLPTIVPARLRLDALGPPTPM